jgi:outer membrane lipoprotein-sorting protein
MRNILIGFILLITTQSLTQSPSGDDVLKRLDQNMTSNSKVVVSKMIIHGRRGSRTIESKSWIQGTDQSFTEYLAPAREKGTKMLKLGDQLWTYSPSTDRTIRIAGHMLRQSVMGSDLSYEDMMEDPELHKIYSANIIKEEILNDRVCWILELIAKKEDVAYHSRKLWVDKDRFVALKETRYAKSGKLLKTTEIKEVKKIENRWVPMRIVFKDELKSGDGTEFIVDSIEFDVAIPDYIFSKAALRR